MNLSWVSIFLKTRQIKYSRVGSRPRRRIERSRIAALREQTFVGALFFWSRRTLELTNSLLFNTVPCLK